MKIIEKIGWLVFLFSLIFLVVTITYGIIRWVVTGIWYLLNTYNDNLFDASIIASIALIVGVLMIRQGASNKESDH